MSKFKKIETGIEGLYIIEPTVFGDNRGFFLESYNKKEFEEIGTLNVVSMGRGMAWLDTGTHDGLLEASNFVKTIQSRQSVMVACPEEIAFNNGWITKEKVKELAEPLLKSEYGKYLMNIIKEK